MTQSCMCRVGVDLFVFCVYGIVVMCFIYLLHYCGVYYTCWEPVSAYVHLMSSLTLRVKWIYMGESESECGFVHFKVRPPIKEI